MYNGKLKLVKELKVPLRGLGAAGKVLKFYLWNIFLEKYEKFKINKELI